MTETCGEAAPAMRARRNRSGFTVAEMAFAAAISAMVVGAATAGFLYVMRGERLNSVQTELDIDVRVAMGWLKHDMRLSALERMVFYPPGPGPYSAVSFPMAKDNDGDGFVELDSNGKIFWDKTVIYHVWSNAPSQLRMTTFEPRNNNLTAAQMQEQLARVVVDGSGIGTYGSTSTQTRVLFENLFDWSINGRGGRYDAYSPTVSRDVGFNLGSIILTNGMHQFKFTVVGKNAASGGYRVGLDSLTVSPCGVDREAEGQLPVAAQAGATAAAELMTEGSWGGNYQLSFPATATGQSFTLNMRNDQWEERNFRGTGAMCDGTVVEFDETVTPRDFVLRLDGLGYAWTAEDQSEDETGYPLSGDRMKGYAVRVLLRGSDMIDGGMVKMDGGKAWILFRGSPVGIIAAYIAECASSTNRTPDTVGAAVPLLFGGSASREIYSSAWAGPANFSIDKNKSYIVSYLIEMDSGFGNPWAWREASNTCASSYVIPASGSPTAADLTDATWSDRSNVIATNEIYGTWMMYSYYKTNGYFTSQIVDTQLNAPQYSDIAWSAERPSGTYMGVKVRSGASPDMSGAPAWSSVAAVVPPAAISPGNGRYVQFQVQMKPDSYGYYTPKLKDMTIKWTGETRVADMGVTVTTGPNQGIFELTVDGQMLMKGIGVNLEIYEDVRAVGATNATRLTSSVSTEVEPRNSGK